MRSVLMAGSDYSERALATLAALHAADRTPVACLCRVTLDRRTVARKAMQYGVRGLLRYAARRLRPGRGRSGDGAAARFENERLARRVDAAGLAGTSLRQACERLGVPFRLAADVNGPDALAFLREHGPDVVVYTGGGILREPLIRIPRRGVLNAHAGVLPEYRGMNVTEWAVLRGDEPGVTVHFIDPGIDTGRILFVEPAPLEPGDTSLARLRSRLVDRTVDALVRGVMALESDAVEPVAQRPEEGRQYFVMHQSLLEVAEARLERRVAALAR